MLEAILEVCDDKDMTIEEEDRRIIGKCKYRQEDIIAIILMFLFTSY